MDIAKAIAGNPRLQKLLWKGHFGLETERLRVDETGRLAHTPHPEGLGSKVDHPFITTDFSESQLELISPPMDSLQEAHGFIQTLLNVVRSELPAGERLWPQSMPPILPEDHQIPLARFDGDASGRIEYREYLSRVYGRSRQTISGSHFNFSFRAEFLEQLAGETDTKVETLKEAVYLKVVRNLMRHRWLLVGLLGRSPVAHESLHLKELSSGTLLPVCCEHGVSIRCSAIGYRNPESLLTDYSSIEGYSADLNHLIEQGKLLNPNELYLPVRIKTVPDGDAVSHIELRMIDLDPQEKTGVSLHSLRFLHLFIIYSLLKEESNGFSPDEQVQADSLQNEVACWGFAAEDPQSPSTPIQKRALHILKELQSQLAKVPLPLTKEYLTALQHFQEAVEHGESAPVNHLKRAIAEKGFIAYHLERGQAQIDKLEQDAFKFHAYLDLELSTQLLLKAAVRRGIHFELLDRKQNFIRLTRDAKQEYVMQATKTSLDPYSSILAMENKKVTKQILREKGIATPTGLDFADIDEARASWERFRGQAVVIKPLSTNFGLGISILKENSDEAAFEQAIATAFKEDQQILIEAYETGNEYRFFLIDDQVVAILRRLPANVIGDGRLSIRELVALKNKDPLRGKGYVTPLERIELKEPEQRYLQAQGLDLESVPDAGKTIFLRENSNISTGGDSIDYTDRIHSSYAGIASAAANALRVKITGLDMIIQDIDRPAGAGNHSIIEMNFNPAIHIHCHPHHGENRRLDERILSALGFM